MRKDGSWAVKSSREGRRIKVKKYIHTYIYEIADINISINTYVVFHIYI